MPTYRYRAINEMGKNVAGAMNAVNTLDLENKIKDLGYELIDYKVAVARKAIFKKNLKPKDMIMFCVHMEELDRAGVPILESLIDMRDTIETPKMRDIIADLVELIRGGEQLSSALKKRGDVFDDLFCGLIAVGEETGNIGEAFGHLSKHIKWNNDFRRKIKKAIRYPIALIIVMLSVISLMMVSVVPKLVNFLNSQGFELPFYTKALIATSNFFVANWIMIFLFVIGTPIVIVILYRQLYPVKHFIDNLALKLPAIGPVVLKINLARFVKFFAVTFTSGLGVLESLEVSRKVVSNAVIRITIDEIISEINDGSSITQAIASKQHFPSLVVRMFKVGEESGNMDRALANVNFFYEREIDDSVEAMVGMIQPTLLVVMGGLLTWIIAAVFGPVYGSFSKMKF